MYKAVYPPLLCFCISLVLVLVSHFTITNTFLSVGFLFLALIFIVDLKGRVNDYVHLIDKPAEYFTNRVLDRYGRSWCGRTVVTGTHPPAKVYFHAKGYRWYHILPDKTFSLASPFLRPSFWCNLFCGHRR